LGAVAAVLLFLLAAVPAFTPSLSTGSSRSAGRGAAARARSVVQRQADGSMLAPGGPLVVYAQALMDAAAAKNEQVQVTQDVLKIKSKFADEEFLNALIEVQNDWDNFDIDKAKKTIALLQPLKSDAVPKFIVFLAKKRRLISLKRIANEYVASLYQQQSIAPVLVKSAQRLSEEQQKSIKDKMKEKTGAKDIKLVMEVDASLLAGFTLEWGYTDPELLAAPCEGIDLSLKNYLRKSALNEGVVLQG
jgi:F-type H+-transporting ATPase subunit delta